MGVDSSAGGSGRRRGFARAASFSVAMLGVLLLAGGCGESGHGAETDPEKGSDAAILNDALARELTLLDLYTGGNRLLGRSQRPLGRRLRAQEQEYVDAITKAIRGLGGDTEAEAEEVDLTGVKDAAALLVLATELEEGAVEFYVDEATHLYTAAPRTLDAWLAAGHGEHLGTLPPGGG
jgi:Ferritin-like domain